MVGCDRPKFMLSQRKIIKECEFQEICPTTNYWVEDKKDFIEEVCKTRKCVDCIQRLDFINEDIRKGSEEWQKRVKYFEERRKMYPPYGIIGE